MHRVKRNTSQSRAAQSALLIVNDKVLLLVVFFFFFQAEDGIRDYKVTGVQTCALPISASTSAVRVPVTADVEAGYGNRPEDAALTARAVIEAGAVGMNLEDATGQPENPLLDLSLQIEKLKAVLEEARRTGVPIVLNARTDVYLLEVGAPKRRYELALKRLAAFRDAGADCLFVPGVRDSETIRRFVVDLQHPINILAGPGSPSIPELEKLSVARVSLGSAPMRATLGLLRRMAEELKSSGTYRTMEGAPSHADVNRMMG